MFKSTKEVVPFFTAILIFLAYESMQGYYDAINIDIYNYVDTSELLLSFIPFLFNINRYLIISLAIFYMIYISSGMTDFKKYGKITFGKTFSLDGLGNKRIVNISYITALCLIVISLICTHALSIEKHATLIQTLSYVIVFGAIFFYITSIRYFLHEEIRKKSIVFIYLLPICTTAYYVNNFSYLEAKKVIQKGEKYISFYYDEKLIKPDSCNVFFGETKNYFFMYNIVNSNTSVYKKSNSDNITYLNNRKKGIHQFKD